MKVERIQLQTGVVYSNPGDGVRVSATGDSHDKRQKGRQRSPQDENTDGSAHHPDADEASIGGSEVDPTKRARDHVLDITA